MSELFYRIALTKVPKVGAVNSKNLIAYCGSAEAVFKAKRETLTKIIGIGEGIAAGLAVLAHGLGQARDRKSVV